MNRIDELGRECSKCHEYKVWDSYHKSRAHPYGKYPACKDCHNARAKEYRDKPGQRERHREYTARWRRGRGISSKETFPYQGDESDPKWDKAWEYNLTLRYGITYNTYQALLDEQDARCWICQVQDEDLDYRLAVDHCHKTGEIRGLLCRKCNSALGHLNDNPQLVRRALAYLER